MRLTETHLRFWQEKKALPQGAVRLRTEQQKTRLPLTLPSADQSLIHACISAHAGTSTLRIGTEASSLLTLLRSQRRQNRCLSDYLQMLLDNGTYAARARYARRWIQRIKH